MQSFFLGLGHHYGVRWEGTGTRLLLIVARTIDLRVIMIHAEMQRENSWCIAFTDRRAELARQATVTYVVSHRKPPRSCKTHTMLLCIASIKQVDKHGHLGIRNMLCTDRLVSSFGCFLIIPRDGRLCTSSQAAQCKATRR